MKRFLKGYAIFIWFVCLGIAIYLLFNTTNNTTNRMKLVERGMNYKIYVDTNTGLCYMMTGKNITVLYDHDGVPYVENGWRDYDD